MQFQRDTLILLSGGLDSAVLGAMERDRLGLALFIEYGQPAIRQEREASRKIAEHLGVKYRIARIAMPGMEDMNAEPGKGARVVPARNMVFLSYGVSLALASGLSRVVYGATAGDRGGYIDCRFEFTDAMRWVASHFDAQIAAPLDRMDKAEIVATGRRLGAPMGLPWSCYRPSVRGEPCGVCNSCVERAVALG